VGTGSEPTYSLSRPASLRRCCTRSGSGHGCSPWGATRDEIARAYPGDELVTDADSGATMATTLPAPPERVWPWLAQMGGDRGDRGGWYSWDWLDNSGESSADRIVPEWQSLEVGSTWTACRRVRTGSSWWLWSLTRPWCCGRATAFSPGALLRPAVRSNSLVVRRRDLGLPSAAWTRRRDPPGDPFAEPEPTATVSPAVRPAGGGTRAFHHADPPVPQPAQACRRRGVTRGGRTVAFPTDGRPSERPDLPPTARHGA
jgi:hypothetical protein